jgi:opacity protein-like surface antigen
MGRSIALILAAAVAAGVSASAHAADLLPPPPPMIEAPPPPVDYGGWYLRGDVGVGIYDMSNLRSTFDNPLAVVPGLAFDQQSLGDSFIIGAGVGYQFNNWFRFDVTGEYRTAANYRATNSYTDIWSAQVPKFSGCGGVLGATPRCFDHYQGQVRSAVFLANGYVDLGTWYGITPFVGAGVGLANHWFEHFNDFATFTPNGGGSFGYARDTSQTNFAWALMAGLGYNVTPNLKLEMSYRYLDMGRITSGQIFCRNDPTCSRERHSFDLASHDIRLGFRYALGGAPAPIPVMLPPSGPLIRKY